MLRIHSLLGLSLAASVLATTTSAQFDPHLVRGPQQNAPLPKPDLDVRLDANGLPTEEVRAALENARTPAALAARALAAQRLAQRVPMLAIDDHALFGTPHFVRSTVAFLSPAVAGGSADAEATVRGFLDEYRGLFEISPGEILSARRTRDYETAHNGLRHLTWKQQIAGVELLGCELRANVTARGELLNLSSTMLPRPDGDFATSPIGLTDEDALTLAAAEAGIALVRTPTALGAAEGPSRRRTWSSVPELRADEPITTELVYFPRTRTDIRAAWSVVVPEIGIGNTYDVVVDATTGEILRRTNRLQFALGGTQPITFNVYTSDSPAPGSPGNPTPNGFQFPLVSRQLVTVDPAQVVAWSPNSWIDDGGNETLGNNVDAHTDLNSDNSPDLPRPQGSPPRTFDFPCDQAMAPTTYRSAAVTQIFYLANRYHDKLFSLGFDEAAGNFQQTNFSGQGVGGDPVQGDAQDGSGTNNANFGTTGSDGSTGRMQMYVFTGPTPDRDGDLDADIVFHELTHGVSIRLTDGQVSGTQAGGMGEGWGDFVGLCLNSQPADDPNAVYCTGGYTTLLFAAGFTDNYYFGIRRFPYSTDLNKNPETYADIDTAQQSYPPAIPRSPAIGNQANEVHNVGEVWCVTLWECRANLIAAHGFAGNDTILQLVVDGLKIVPGTPNFLQSRDSILQSDLVDSGGANLNVLWNAFAKRGQGASATSPAGSTSSGVHEAFDTPNLILFAYPNGTPQQLSPGAPSTFQVVVSGLGTATPTPGTGQLAYSVNGGAFTSVAMTQTSPNHYDATLPGFACLDAVRFYVSTGTNSGVVTDPAGAPATSNLVYVATGSTVVYADSFETDQGWTAVNLGATTGDWQRGVPVNDPTWAYAPASDADGSGQCWLTQNQAGNTDVDNGAVQLTSRAFDFSSPLSNIAYEYYLNLTDQDGSDRLLVEINTNGGAGAWTQIAVHDTSGGNAWRHHEIPAAAVQALGVTLSSNTMVRYTANDGGTQSIVEAGVDGFRVSQLACVPPITAYCFGDGTGTACPCGNNGAAGAGCASSLGHGGSLTASGSASVAADTLVLSGTGMPDSSALYFQGTIQDNGGAGTAFGDGLRCAAGNVIRLGTKANAGGASSYPQGGDLSISVKGLIPIAGGVRDYQVWYRNADPTFCTSATFNLTNGLNVTWQP